jgi:hypothetical protein
VDHFFDFEKGIDLAAGAENGELGDFVTRLYSVRQLSKDGHRIHLAALGSVSMPEGPLRVEVHKEYGFEGSTIHVTYHVRNRGDGELHVGFGTEVNLSLERNDPESMRILAGPGSGATLNGEEVDAIDGVSSVRVYDLGQDVTLQLEYADPAYVSAAPIRAGNGEGPPGYQASCFIPQWRLDLAAGEEWTQELTLALAAG